MSRHHPFAAIDSARPDLGVVVGNQQRLGHAWQATAQGWQPVVLKEGQRCNGFAMAYVRDFAAVYASGGTVWLQVGDRAWDASKIVRVTQDHERADSVAYSVQTVNGERDRITLKMPPAVAEFRVIDPTYDEIASLADDIMKTFPYVASDGWTAGKADVQAWVGRVLPMWQSGITHEP